MNVDSLTSKKVAGIPVLPVIFVVAAIGLYLAYKSKSTPVTAPVTTPDISTDAGVDTTQPTFSATPTITQPSGVNTGSVTAISGPDTDSLWARRAVGYLVANGYSLDIATSAITKYLANSELSTVEAAARDKAVQQFGLPPETLPSSSTTPAAVAPVTHPNSPPPTRQGVPPTTHIVKGTRDNTWASLAQLYYTFSGSGASVLIEGANPSLRSPFAVGTPVHIPRLHAPRMYRTTSATHDLYSIARKNAISPSTLQALNPSRQFPVKIGTSVRVG